MQHIKHDKIVVLVLNRDSSSRIEKDPLYKKIFDNYIQKQMRKNPALSEKDIKVIACSTEDFDNHLVDHKFDILSECTGDSKIVIVGHHYPSQGCLMSDSHEKFSLKSVSGALAVKLACGEHGKLHCIERGKCGENGKMIKIVLTACFTADPNPMREDQKSFAEQFHSDITNLGIACEVVGQRGLFVPAPVSKSVGGAAKMIFGCSEPAEFSSRRIPLSTGFFKADKFQGVFSWNPLKTAANVVSIGLTAGEYLFFDQSRYKQRIKTRFSTERIADVKPSSADDASRGVTTTSACSVEKMRHSTDSSSIDQFDSLIDSAACL